MKFADKAQEKYIAWYDEREKEIIKNLFTFLKIPSISSELANKKDMLSCAEWVKDFLENVGLQVEMWETQGNPVVFGSFLTDPKNPTVLFYLHYDVQPVDPLELWKSPPFEPEIRDGIIYARGACDNKGQCFYTLCALNAFLKLSKQTKINIKVCVEGEEEIGSPGLSQVLPEKKEKLKADHLLIVDVDMSSLKAPRLTLGTRGIVTTDITLKAAKEDLHSGLLGGIALNPIKELVRLLAKLWDEKGKIAIPGFYEDVKEASKDFLSKLDVTFDRDGYKEMFGLKDFGGEEGFGLTESNWMRPSLEINGISGGYAGEGFKTIIPAKANAKLSCRIVPDQDPEKVGRMIEEFLQKNSIKGIDIKIECLSGGKARWSDINSPLVQIVAKTYEEVLNTPCGYALSGATIPIGPELCDASGAQMVLMGFVLPSDGAHAPNEHFAVSRFKMGFIAIARILERIAERK